MTTPNAGEDAETEHSYTVGGYVKLCGCFGKSVWGFLKRLSI